MLIKKRVYYIFKEKYHHILLKGKVSVHFEKNARVKIRTKKTQQFGTQKLHKNFRSILFLEILYDTNTVDGFGHEPKTRIQ